MLEKFPLCFGHVRLYKRHTINVARLLAHIPCLPLGGEFVRIIAM